MMHPAVHGFGRDANAVKGKKLERDLLRRVLQLARPYRKQLVGFVITVILAAVISAVPPLILRALIDTAIPEKDRQLVGFLAFAAVFLALLNAGLTLIQRYYSARIGEGLIFDMRTALFDHVQHQPLSFFTRTQTGSLMSRMNNDVIGAQQAVTNTLGTVFSNIVSVVVTITFMLALEWRLTLLTLVILPLFIIPAKRMGPRLQRLDPREHAAERVDEQHDRRALQRGWRARRQAVRQALPGIDDVLRPRRSRARHRRADGDVLARALRRVGPRRGHRHRDRLLRRWESRDLRARSASARSRPSRCTSSQIYQPLTQLANARVDVLTALVSFERVFEVLDFPPLISNRPGAVDLVEPVGRVEFEHVWFRHPSAAMSSIPSLEEQTGATDLEDESAWILRDVSFRVAPGELVALVGPSGAGKTTTALLVPRIYDVSAGEVRVDGHDVRDYTLESLRGSVGMVMQDPHLFHDTVRANLRYARPDATDAELVEACRAARIHDMIAGLPDGYDTLVGERGYRMSGGEKQRLAIARMLLKDPAVVILDEATSHLDSESELAIQHALADALHRPHVTRDRPSLVDHRRRRPHPRPRRRPYHREWPPRGSPARRWPLHRPLPDPGGPPHRRRGMMRDDERRREVTRA